MANNENTNNVPSIADFVAAVNGTAGLSRFRSDSSFITSDVSRRGFIPGLFTSEGMSMAQIYKHVVMTCRVCDIDPDVHTILSDLHKFRVGEVTANDTKAYDVARSFESAVNGAFERLITRINDNHRQPFTLTMATLHVMLPNTAFPVCARCSVLDIVRLTDSEFLDAVNANHSTGQIVTRSEATNNGYMTCDWCGVRPERLITSRSDGFTNAACIDHAAKWTLSGDNVVIITR